MYKMTKAQSLPRPNACFPLLVPMGAGVFFGARSLYYYTHNIGDYRRDTAHLSLLEHGVYRQLLDTYHLTEQLIPTETELVCRRLSARTDEERQAIQYVLNEFFLLTKEGYRHAKSDQAIREYQSKAERARANGKLGGRPAAAEKPVNIRPKTEVVISRNPEETTSQDNLLTNKPNNLSIKDTNVSLSGSSIPTCPHEEILKLWKKHLPHLTQPRLWDGARATNLRARWLQASKPSAFGDGYSTRDGGLEWWDSFFAYIATDTSLPAGFKYPDGRVWSMDLPWLVNATNFSKIIDGKYDKK